MRGLLIEGAVYLLLLFTPLAFGGVELWAVGVVQILSGVAFAAWAWGAWTGGRAADNRRGRKVGGPKALPVLMWSTIALFALLVAFQLVPLPASWIATLSPGAHRLYSLTLPGYADGKEFDAAALPSWLVEAAAESLPA